VYKEIMKSRALIASWLLVTVLLAPVPGLAMCVSAAPASMADCAHCATHSHRAGLSDPAPASAPAAPCCESKAPIPKVGEMSAQIVAPVQIALMPAAAPVAMLPATAALRVEKQAAPPHPFPPLLLLCTLLI
jgi:hypothetical protein